MPFTEAGFFSIPYYHDYISPAQARAQLAKARAVKGVAGMLEVGSGGGLETEDALIFLAAVYSAVKDDLAAVLRQRAIDRKFMDERVKACARFNSEMGREISDPDYVTILGLEDSAGRIVMGPKTADYCNAGGKPIAPIPEFLRGPHVTLFGPPGSAKMAINAMNSYHRQLKDEPPIVTELLRTHTSNPKWGADDEDSKTPLRADLIEAGENLTRCFEGSLLVDEKYQLAKEHLAIPIKRIPGLALPAPFLFFENDPIPLHLYDFVLHLARNWENPRALVFYIPKLENEEEARYVHKLIETCERMIQAKHSAYKLGTIRLMIVLENPRAILRTHEIMNALYPYFAGASLGWHDFLASTARLFKEDGHYRIPVKADPDIVIKYIQASHALLADVVGSRGGIKVGGMYGILPLDTDRYSDSFQVCLKGYIKDVITQLKRDLTGFWVAHPDFVRLGLALVEAWKIGRAGNASPLETLVKSLLQPKYHSEILKFINGPDIQALDKSDPSYTRALIVADIKESDFIANNHPDEIRYNVFQSLQYLADWLCGNGCVALPAVVNGVPVRVMDDLATAERSRWEVWHELKHGRFAIEDFLQIVHEEMAFIRKDLSNDGKIVQVKWDENTAKWYPAAMRIMLQLMTAVEPVEFATELLLPFTVDDIRGSADPLAAMCALDPEKYRLDAYIERFNFYFEACGSRRFAAALGASVIMDLQQAQAEILEFSKADVIAAAAFHGDIGESKRTLDTVAAGEQALVLGESEQTKSELRRLGAEYRAKFGFKFLLSAKGKSAGEILQALKSRLASSVEDELQAARLALWEISQKRMTERPLDGLKQKIELLRAKYKITGAAVSLLERGQVQTLCFGESESAQKPVTPETCFEIASLSKTLACAFAIGFFSDQGIPLSTPVNELCRRLKLNFELHAEQNGSWADEVRLEHLMNHTALNLHYIAGYGADQRMPRAGELLGPVKVLDKPGLRFRYSGAGFLLLEYLIEAISGKSIAQVTQPFFARLGLRHLSFLPGGMPGVDYAHGYRDSGEAIAGGRLNFPACAAGAFGTSADMALFLKHLSAAFHDLAGSGGIAHDTAVRMLHGSNKGSFDFMGVLAGLGVFVAEAGSNRFAVHQGANDGFRALYLHCFAGPDQGKGFVIFCNSENRGVLFNSMVAQELIRAFEFHGVDVARFESDFAFENLAPEQIVNLGYKKLIFDAFEPDLPEPIVQKGPLDPRAAANLAVGAKIISVSDQRFARAENLLSPNLPVFDPELFGRQGKIMDSWESRRHNEADCDRLHFALRTPSAIGGVHLSTCFHDGNHPEFVRVLARDSGDWLELVPKTAMLGHAHLDSQLAKSGEMYREVMVEIFPDGGLSRIGLFKEAPTGFRPLGQAHPVRFADPIPKSKKPLTIPYRPSLREHKSGRSRTIPAPVNFASAAWGASLVGASNEHYGPAVQVISPFSPLHMFDGLESARSRKPGHCEQVTIRLADKIRIVRVVCDFTFFVNNNPMAIAIHGEVSGQWIELVVKTEVKAFAANQIEFSIANREPFENLRVTVYPDGGINRIKVFGSPLV